ncbi:MAG: CBS domain-containing protein [Methanomassiliicoccales archaeon]
MRRIGDCKVEEVMSRNVITVESGTSLKDLKGKFEEYDFNAFPVVDGDRMVGIVTKIDLFKAFTTGRKFSRSDVWDLFAEAVKDVMRKAVISVNPDDSIKLATEYMVEFKLRSLPVIEGGRLVGMISRRDIIECLEFE